MSCDDMHARARSGSERAITRFERIVGASLLIALASSCGSKDKPIPADPKARSEFLSTMGAKLKPDERKLLDRFSARLDAQAAAGGPAVEIAVPRALELERRYETQISDAQRNLHQLLESAKTTLDIEVREPTVVRDAKAQSSSEKALRFVVNVSNHGNRSVESLSLRLEFRDASGNYLAVIPGLQLSGVLLPGDLRRSVQMLPLDAQRHQYILDGKRLEISAYPTRVVYVGGEILEPGKELQALESLHRAKIE